MVRLTDHLNMTIAFDWNFKPQTKQTNKTVAVVAVSVKPCIVIDFGILFNPNCDHVSLTCKSCFIDFDINLWQLFSCTLHKDI